MYNRYAVSFLFSVCGCVYKSIFDHKLTQSSGFTPPSNLWVLLVVSIQLGAFHPRYLFEYNCSPYPTSDGENPKGCRAAAIASLTISM